MMTQESCSPCTSTPCQKEEVPKRTALGVSRNCWRRTWRGAVPWRSERVGEFGEEAVVDLAHLFVAGEEAEGAALRDFEDAADAFGGFELEVGLARVRHVGR